MCVAACMLLLPFALCVESIFFVRVHFLCESIFFVREYLCENNFFVVCLT